MNQRLLGLEKAYLAITQANCRGIGMPTAMAAAVLFTSMHVSSAFAQSGAIVYLDATSANTVQAAVVDNGNGTAPVSLGVGAALPTTPTGGDPGVNQWWLRPFGLPPTATTVPATYTHPAGSTLFEISGNPGPENGPRLATTVSGLPAGRYEVFAFFWDVRGAGNWSVRASLTDSTDHLPYFGSGLPGETPAVSAPSVEVTADNASRWLLRAPLGVTAPGTTSITVFVDDEPSPVGSGNNRRTWYDGIGYRLFFPPGDANFDGVTNIADYNIIRDNLGKSVPSGTLGDLDNNSFVTLTDFHVWKAAPHSLGAGASVPEPGSAMLAACGALVVGFLTRRSAKRRRPSLMAACAVVAVMSCAALSTTAQAQITFVDATPLNTTQSASPSGPVGAGVPWAGITATANVVDGQWCYRQGFGAPEGTATPPTGTIVFDNSPTSTNYLMEASGPPGIEDVPRLKTTVSSLPMDTYDVYVYYWVSGDQYAIRGSLTDSASALPLLNNTTGIQIADTTATTTAQLRQVLLGQITGTSISVFVEDRPATVAGNERSWYDGIGYAPGLLPGDVNGDDLVDIADYNTIKLNYFLTNATRAQGDLTGDGRINLDDFAAWRKLVPPAVAAGVSVPEPSSIALLGVGLLAIRRIGRSMRRR